ncbi:MAG: transporter substrate-binding domain-containing protein [Eggerthellaceae bacterium]|nr:transporter substrate-binding domain-containing protein [Eggerthellaceae bacterium]
MLDCELDGESVNSRLAAQSGGRSSGKLGVLVCMIMLCASMFSMVCRLTACAPHSVKTTEGYALLEEGKLSVIAALDNPPYEYYEGSTPTGYGVAVVQELAARMGLECQIRNCDASNHEEGVTKCLTALEDDTADVALASFTARTLESADVDYTVSYYEANQAILVRNDDEVVKRSQLSGDTYAIGALANSLAYTYACVNISENVKTYRTLADCVTALSSGEVAALVLDAKQAEQVLAEQQAAGAGDTGAAAGESAGSPAFKELEKVITADRFVLAVSRIDTGLADALSKEIKAMQDDGTLERIAKEYL